MLLWNYISFIFSSFIGNHQLINQIILLMTENIQFNIDLRAGKPDAYKKLFDLYYASFYGYALKFCQVSSKAEDIVPGIYG